MCQGDGDRGFRSITGLSATHRDVRNKCVGGWRGSTIPPVAIYLKKQKTKEACAVFGKEIASVDKEVKTRK